MCVYIVWKAWSKNDRGAKDCWWGKDYKPGTVIIIITIPKRFVLGPAVIKHTHRPAAVINTHTIFLWALLRQCLTEEEEEARMRRGGEGEEEEEEGLRFRV
jgi:hypothetical protein